MGPVRAMVLAQVLVQVMVLVQVQVVVLEQVMEQVMVLVQVMVPVRVMLGIRKHHCHMPRIERRLDRLLPGKRKDCNMLRCLPNMAGILVPVPVPKGTHRQHYRHTPRTQIQLDKPLG